MYVVYVLQSETYKRMYIGMTNDLERRIKEHNNGKTKSTRYYKPWKVLFIESFSTRLEAREREKYLKSGIGREYIKTWPRSSAG
jgi:putative endonuclease